MKRLGEPVKFNYLSMIQYTSGIVFAFIVLSSFTGFKEGEIPLTFILVVILFVGQQIYEGVAIRDNISQLTHVIGGAIGAFVGYRFNKSK